MVKKYIEPTYDWASKFVPLQYQPEAIAGKMALGALSEAGYGKRKKHKCPNCGKWKNKKQSFYLFIFAQLQLMQVGARHSM